MPFSARGARSARTARRTLARTLPPPAVAGAATARHLGVTVTAAVTPARSDACAGVHAGAVSDEGQVGGGGVAGSAGERAVMAVGTGEQGAVGGQESVVPEGEGGASDVLESMPADVAVGGATQEHQEAARASRGAGAEETPRAADVAVGGAAAATVKGATAVDAVDSRARELPLLAPRRGRAQSGACIHHVYIY